MTVIEILMLDDNQAILDATKKLLHNKKVDGNAIHITCEQNFDRGLEELKSNKYDIIILDVFRGKPSTDNTNQPGKLIFESIQRTLFIPVIFYSGVISEVDPFKSYMVRIVRKSDGVKKLKTEIQNISKSKLIFINKDLNKIINESMKSYFWGFVQNNHKEFSKIADAELLRYLLIRRLGIYLSKEAMEKLTGQQPDNNKTNPLQFYIIPPINMKEPYETGDVLKKSNKIFVILTPSCDLVKREGGQRKASKVLLAKLTPLKETKQYTKYINNKSSGNAKGKLKEIMKNDRSDQYFFLPEIPSIPHATLDFQELYTINESELTRYEKIAKIDDPYAQAIQATFIRYYNRVGCPDLDIDNIISKF